MEDPSGADPQRQTYSDQHTATNIQPTHGNRPTIHEENCKRMMGHIHAAADQQQPTHSDQPTETNP